VFWRVWLKNVSFLTEAISDASSHQWVLKYLILRWVFKSLSIFFSLQGKYFICLPMLFILLQLCYCSTFLDFFVKQTWYPHSMIMKFKSEQENATIVICRFLCKPFEFEFSFWILNISELGKKIEGLFWNFDFRFCRYYWEDKVNDWWLKFLVINHEIRLYTQTRTD
jgi:hypothetical protein